jgi:hypothetical protein
VKRLLLIVYTFTGTVKAQIIPYVSISGMFHSSLNDDSRSYETEERMEDVIGVDDLCILRCPAMDDVGNARLNGGRRIRKLPSWVHSFWANRTAAQILSDLAISGGVLRLMK